MSASRKGVRKVRATVAEFVAKAQAVHGDRYDYSRVDYKNNSTQVEVVCREHGPFFPKPSNHISRGSGCPACAGCKRTTVDDFIARARAVHGGKYDYSKVAYKGVDSRVVIVCPDHGEFRQSAYDHAKGHGCKTCGVLKCSEANKRTLQEFIRRAMAFHGDKYDYGKSVYVNSVTPIEIVCLIHGSFWQVPQDHITRYGCAACSGLAPITKEQFIARAIAVHGDKYDYTNVQYGTYQTLASIMCKEHGVFQQIPKAHSQGHGCPKCATEATTSKGENEVADWLAENGLTVIRNDRDALDGFEIDIYVPDRKTGIEFNGAYWHHDGRLQHTRIHETKALRAWKKGIQIVTVWDFDWAARPCFIKSMLLHRLGLSADRKLNARSCSVRPVDSQAASRFYEQTHIQGAAWRAIANYGLFEDAEMEMVACMSFSQSASRRGMTGEGEWELTRYSTSGIVRGAASKLLKAFIRAHGPKIIWSFSDRQYFNGNTYRTLGFVMDGNVAADYRVMHQNQGKIWHKSAWQRKHIQARLDELGLDEAFDPATDTRTEREMQALAGCIRIMDSGKVRWKLEVQATNH